MSHDSKLTSVTCPNCGATASGNYCAQCGQATHLHKETFWGMIVHFVAHYFHYDSKFLQTMKTLVTQPGELSLAYRKMQRARYLPPVSLYIFVSTVFFIINFFVFHRNIQKFQAGDMKQKMDSIMFTHSAGPEMLSQSPQQKAIELEKASREFSELYIVLEETLHDVPKILFFMVPFMALILKVFFIRRKDTFFVDHAVFSLHVHTFFFLFVLAFMLLGLLIPRSLFLFALSAILFLAVAFLYIVQALHKAYDLHAGKAILMVISMVPVYSFIYSIGLFVFAYRHGVESGLFKPLNWERLIG